MFFVVVVLVLVLVVLVLVLVLVLIVAFGCGRLLFGAVVSGDFGWWTTTASSMTTIIVGGGRGNSCFLVVASVFCSVVFVVDIGGCGRCIFVSIVVVKMPSRCCFTRVGTELTRFAPCWWLT